MARPLDHRAEPRILGGSDLDLWEHDPDAHWPLLDWCRPTSTAVVASGASSIAG